MKAYLAPFFFKENPFLNLPFSIRIEIDKGVVTNSQAEAFTVEIILGTLGEKVEPIEGTGEGGGIEIGLVGVPAVAAVGFESEGEHGGRLRKVVGLADREVCSVYR
jgi:hypothetical protein